MNTKIKMRMLSLLLCFVMLVGLVPTSVFAAGDGTSEATAIEVTDYASFKAAMEDPAILFVKIYNTLSSTISSETGNLIVGTSVSSNKTLIVNADATFTASGVAGKDIVDSLIQTVNGASLTIKGTGTLRFKANGNNAFNAVVRIDGGTVYVQDSVTLHGTYNNATYGCAILNQNGNLNLWGGTLRGEAGYYTNPNYLGAVDLRGGNTVINGNTVVIGNKYSGNSSAGEYPEKLVALTVEDDATLAIYEGAVNLTEGVTINNDSVSIAFADSKVTSDYLMSGIKMFRVSTHESLATNYSKVHDSVYFAQTPANLFAVQPTFQIVSEGNSGTVSFTMNGNYTYSAVQLVKESGVADDEFATNHAGVHFGNTANVYTATEYKGNGTYQTPEGNYKIAVQISGDWYYSNVFAISYGTVQPTEYMVSYNANGGSAVIAQSIEAGQKATKPADPTKADYAFAGWYSDSGLTQAFDFNTPISTDITLYAKWDVVISAANATVTVPVAGEHPDFKPVAGDSSRYTVEFVTWYLRESPYPDLDANSVFEHRKSYSLRIRFTPKAGYQFDSNTVFTVNGKETSCFGGRGDREYSATAYAATYTVTYDANGGTGSMAQEFLTHDNDGFAKNYTFPQCGFTAPAGQEFDKWLWYYESNPGSTNEITPGQSPWISGNIVVKALWKTGEYNVTVSGTVTSFNDASGDITLQLIPEGFSEPAYETIVKGNTVDYYFADVAAGTYTLKVMKENHATREYTVVVGNSSVIQDVKIHLNGDINGDGRVNNKDLGLLMQKLNSWEVEIAGDDGDVNGDGSVNNKDYGLLMQFTNGWDVTLK